MNSRMKRWVVFAGSLLFLVVGWIEAGFDRPSLSVRPQVWLSKPVEWTFRSQSLLGSSSVEQSSNALALTFTDVDTVFQRFKNGSTEPMWSAIQSGVLSTTLSEMDIESVGVRLSINRGADTLDLGESIGPPDFADGRGVIFVRSTEFLEQLGATVGGPVTIELVVSVDKCAPRESFVSCPLADFSGVDLSRGDFERANLRGADLTEANLSGAKLAFADLSGAIGRYMDMSMAWLIGIDIRDAFLEDVNFAGATWTR